MTVSVKIVIFAPQVVLKNLFDAQKKE